MNISVLYNYPVYGGEHDDYALRFIETYNHFRPKTDHETIIVSNGSVPNLRMRNTIRCLGRFPNLRWVSRPNTAKDIGAYLDVAKQCTSDLLICFGGSLYFWKYGWLERIVDSVRKHGNTIYGTMCNSGDSRFEVYPHIRTTGFWLHPDFLASYPKKIITDADRYFFEHGKGCLTSWALKHGMKPKLVTWDSEYDIIDWATAPESFHRGKQEGLLFKDRLADPPYYT